MGSSLNTTFSFQYCIVFFDIFRNFTELVFLASFLEKFAFTQKSCWVSFGHQMVDIDTFLTFSEHIVEFL